MFVCIIRLSLAKIKHAESRLHALKKVFVIRTDPLERKDVMFFVCCICIRIYRGIVIYEAGPEYQHSPRCRLCHDIVCIVKQLPRINSRQIMCRVFVTRYGCTQWGVATHVLWAGAGSRLCKGGYTQVHALRLLSVLHLAPRSPPQPRPRPTRR